MDRIIRSVFVNDIRDLPGVASTESEALISGHARVLCALLRGEHREAGRDTIKDFRREDEGPCQSCGVRSHVHGAPEILDREPG